MTAYALALDALVVDTATRDIGYVKGFVGGKVQLRPPGGGKEWDAAPDAVREATDQERLAALSERGSALNAQGGLAG